MRQQRKEEEEGSRKEAIRQTSMNLIIFLVALLSLSSVLSLSPAAAATIPLGSTLTPANSTGWTSPNRTFSLSFISSPNSPPSNYIAAITYSGGIPVWSAATAANSTPVVVPASASLSLTSSGNLVLTSSASGSILWQSSTANKGVASAALDESGNLKLTSANSTVIWQSFDHPTDTILQSQNLTFRQVLRSGPYSFTLLKSGNLTLQWTQAGNTSITYYNKALNSLNSSFSNATLTAPAITLQTNGIVSLLDASLPTPATIAYSSNYGETADMRFLRLDSDGNLRTYSASRGNSSPNEQWSAVEDQCQVFGWCGNMGICSYNDTSPVCGCPSQNFEFVDQNDFTKGCKRKVEIQNCSGNPTMLLLNNTQFLTYPPEISNEEFFVGITACRLNCLSGTSCVASTALADGSGLCFLKVSNFVSGYQSPALPSTSYVKVCPPVAPNVPPALGQAGSASSKLKAWVVAVVVVGTVLGLIALESGLWWCFCQSNPKFGPSSAQYALLEYASGAPVQFSYKELHRSTKGFKEKLGAGGFGAVYRGVLANKMVVAVKQLEGIEQGEKQFRMEVATISSTHHLNLVRLIGFCSEGRHRLLVYEFLKNCSLDAFLFSAESSGKLNWAARFKVAVGTARGITYLHEECRDCIVHCDIKPENILLDENYNAKVSDFGLAKLVNPKDHRHRTLTSVRGTRGYLAPEWLANLPITSSSDVYSYGMVLLEIVSGRRNFDVSEDTGRKKFSIWAYEEFEKEGVRNIVDKRLPESDVDMEQLDRAVQVSFWCIQEQPSQRPSMGKVVQMLEGIMEIERPPAPKATDGSLSGTSGSVTISSSFSTIGASQPVDSTATFVPSTAGSSSEISRRNLEKASSSLLAANQSI